MKEVKGVVERIVFEDRAKPRAILTAHVSDDNCYVGVRKVFVDGEALERGRAFLAYGLWETERYRGVPEPVFQSSRLLPALPVNGQISEIFLRRLLEERLRVQGDLLARVCRGFAKAGWENLPRRLLEGEEDVPNVLPSELRTALRSILLASEGRGTTKLVVTAGLERKAQRQVLVRYGETDVLFRDPYRVTKLPDVGFGNAHRLAKAVGRANMTDKRLFAILLDHLMALEAKGDTYVTLGRLTRMASETSARATGERLSEDQVLEHLPAEIATTTVDGEMALGLARFLGSEEVIAERLGRAMAEERASVLPEQAQEKLFLQEKFQRLDDVQREAVRMALREPVSIVTGGPGTGKSAIMEAVVAGYAEAGFEILLAAPTGKAAKRLAETTGRDCTTLHRLLEARPVESEGWAFGRNEANPLGGPSNRCVVIVDEASMLDVELAAALVRALPERGRLVLVGDRDQLPSVGPGAVLGDLLNSGRIPHTALVNVYRQGKGSAISAGAALIRSGKLPELPAKSNQSSDLGFIPSPGSRIAATVAKLVQDECARSGAFENMAVITPMNEGSAGITELNAVLSQVLNPGGERFAEHLAFGDRVILVKNDHDRGVMNGDIGVVTRPSHGCGFAVLFQGSGKLHEFDMEEADNFLRAYAITAHRSQGSQYDTVFLVMHAGQEAMLDRAILYTAWTRARSKLVLVGERHAFATAASRDASASRQTVLAGLCRARLPALPEACPSSLFATSQASDDGLARYSASGPPADGQPRPDAAQLSWKPPRLGSLPVGLFATSQPQSETRQWSAAAPPVSPLRRLGQVASLFGARAAAPTGPGEDNGRVCDVANTPSARL